MFIPGSYEHLLLISRQLGLLLQQGKTKEQALTQLQTTLGETQSTELKTIEQLLSDDSTDLDLPKATGPLNALKRLINPVREHGGDVIRFFAEFNKTFLNQDSLYNIKNYDTSGIMLYLVGLITLAAIVVTIYSVYVFPSIQALFDEAGSPLPPLSQFVFTLVLDWGVFIAFCVFLLIVLFISIAIKIKHTVSSLTLFGTWMLRLPGFQLVASQYNLYLCLRFLQLMMRSGVSQDNSLKIIETLAKNSNTILDKQFQTLILKPQNTLLNNPLSLAASLGNLDDELSFQIEALYEKAITNFSRLKDAVSFTGIIIVALVIGNLIFAMYMPIFQMGKIIGGE
ncbi:MAG: hypothetical protein ACC653_05625 [Gammaproteobacteria bacterium]